MTETPSTTRLQTLRDALDSGTMRPVRRMLSSLHPAEIGSLIESLPNAEREVVWNLVDPDDAGETLLHVNDDMRANLIAGTDEADLLAALEGMEVDDLADILDDLPERLTNQVLLSLDQQNRQRLEAVLSYPEDSAGGLMNVDTITVRPDVELDVVLRYLRLRGDLPENTDALFVVNRYNEYMGALNLSDLLTNDTDTAVAEIMLSDTRPIPADLHENAVAKLFEERDLVSAAVVDEHNKLIGRITIDDVVDVIRDQADHNIMSLAGLDEEEDVFGPIIPSAKRRALWLLINLGTAILASWVINRFQVTIDKIVALAVLMPIVASMGGNAGSQTLTLMVRGLALGQVQSSNARWLLGKEIAVSLLNGVGLALLTAGITYIWFNDVSIAIIIGVALIINLLIAAIAGVIIPLFLKQRGTDPALAGNIVLTTVTDVFGFMVFLGLATLILT
ncbi:MAG: magnesium transporter [Gammaproteobacteria bacterium]|nr:magnesium transporter [Gammaproteobacteria bacterium]NNC97299.1 magnesium transporter [Gammaproteobacteria bacterium]NNM14677.1 magnesium transporter [Gammaproteobacteria bacterium]